MMIFFFFSFLFRGDISAQRELRDTVPSMYMLAGGSRLIRKAGMDGLAILLLGGIARQIQIRFSSTRCSFKVTHNKDWLKARAQLLTRLHCVVARFAEDVWISKERED